MAPEETTNETTQTPAVVEAPASTEKSGETDVDPFEGATKGIKDRLKRLEKQLLAQKVAPLEQRVQELEALLESKGVEVEKSAEAGKETPAEVQEETAESKVAMLTYLRKQAAFDAGLPAEALPFLTASSEAELTAQAEMLKPLFSGRRRILSPVRPDSGGATALPTFKRSQLRDAKFFTENREAIMQAIAEGRFDRDN